MSRKKKSAAASLQARASPTSTWTLGEQMLARKKELMKQFESKDLPTPVTITMTAPRLQQAPA